MEDDHYLKMAKRATWVWGVLIMILAVFAAPFENLIQAVNIFGSLFYGTILGIVLTAIFLKKVSSNGVIFGAILAETTVILGFIFSDIGFLWFNVIGCLLVMGSGLVFTLFEKKRSTA